ncbi:MAG: XRE family transcriptional regulator [Proteobacteria bacterium]|nr:XRE family transcriptional regulator [Pseudomonadota bacterium]
MRVRETIATNGWTQAEAAARLGIGPSRVSDLVRDGWNEFAPNSACIK